MSNGNKDMNIWLVVMIALFFGMMVSACTVNDITTNSTTSTTDRGSAEYRYAKERVKLEGYSDKEASQAADAIIKFHNAQKARRQ